MSEERRSSVRHVAYLAAQIEADHGDTTIAITRDVGAAGLLVYTRIALAIGQQVKLEVAYEKDRTLHLSGKVVRQEPLSPEESSLWFTKVAIAVDGGEAVLADLFSTLADKRQP
jgi:hypothetical protein